MWGMKARLMNWTQKCLCLNFFTFRFGGGGGASVAYVGTGPICCFDFYFVRDLIVMVRESIKINPNAVCCTQSWTRGSLLMPPMK